MLKTDLLHPEILKALAGNGHGGRVLISDANFPFATGVPLSCKKVFLNLSPGILTVTEVMKVVVSHIPVESAILMMPADGNEPAIHAEFRTILGEEIVFTSESRANFYRETRSDETCLLIATGDMRRCANILIVIGCR